MTRCSLEGCDNEEDTFPFKCKLCAQYFCSKHRLPEQHNCPQIAYYDTEEYKRTKIVKFQPKVVISDKEYEDIQKGRKKRRFSTKRNRSSKHFTSENRFLSRSAFFTLYSFGNNAYNMAIFAISLGLVLSLRKLFLNRRELDSAIWLEIVYTFIIAIIIFGGQEIVQSIFAKKLNLKATTAIWLQGLIITVFSILFPLILIPGHLILQGFTADQKERGITAMSGILWCMIFGFTTFILSLIPSAFSPLNSFGNAIPMFPMFIFTYTIFRLLPFGIGSGVYIKNWNERVYWSLLVINFAMALTGLILASV